MKIALFVTATGKYNEFLPTLFETANKYFMRDYFLTIVLFTDKIDAEYESNVLVNKVEHSTFPNSTMNRCKFYRNFMEQQLHKFNYCFAIDADAYFVDKVGSEILEDLVAVRHCAWVNKKGPFETNKKSSCFVKNTSGNYYGGGFYGGKSFEFYYINKLMDCCIENDKAKGIIPIWHDESALNKVLTEFKPKLPLSPSYHYPGWGKELKLNPWIKKLWEDEKVYFRPKIVFIEKTFENKGVEYFRS